MSKRIREDDDEDEPVEEKPEDDAEKDDGEEEIVAAQGPGRKVKARRTCPYLGTINRHLLDFDFEKICSVSLNSENIYVDLIDGKYFQGRGQHTHAYRHSVEKNHYVWMNTTDGRVYCIPDEYEVLDASLADIKYNLFPKYTEQEIKTMSTQVRFAKALDGTDFIPGCMGLNNIKNSDYQNVIVQIICQVVPLRNFLLGYELDNVRKRDPVLWSLACLMRKMYNPKNFKGIVSPHEFYQAVGQASQKKFFEKTADPVAFYTWLMGYLHKKLKQRDGSSTVTDVFQGEVQVKTCPATDETRVVESKNQTLMMMLELPDEPLFKDNFDFIPQVPLFNLLDKFNGEKPFESIAKGGESREVKRYSLRRVPPYVVFVVKRFRNNNFFIEKNPTIVTFPLKGLDLRDYIHPDALPANPETKYDLVSNVVHDGKPQSGKYKIQVLHGPTAQWYEIHDLAVKAVLPQMVALTESYIQVYQRQDVKPDGSFETFEAMATEETGPVMETVTADIEMAPEDLAEAGIIIG